MQLGIFARTFAGNGPEPVMQAARDAGFDAVQYNFACSGLDPIPEAVDPATCDGVAGAARETGVTIVGLSGTTNMAHPDEDVRADSARRLRAVIAAAPLIGAPLVTLCTGSRDADDKWRAHPDNGSDAAWRDMVRSMADALEAAEAAGVDVGIEPELANVVTDAERAERLIAEMGSRRLKVVLDPANLFETAPEGTRRALVEDAVDRLGSHIAIAHAKDRAADGAFVAAGQGVIDFGHFIDRLRSAGFDGPLVAHGCTADEAPGVARHLSAIL